MKQAIKEAKIREEITEVDQIVEEEEQEEMEQEEMDLSQQS